MGKKVKAEDRNKELTRVIAAPEYLKDFALQHWDRIIPLLVGDKMICPIDVGAIEMACQFYDDYRKAENLRDRKSAADGYMKIMRDYGLTFASRDRLKVEDKPASKDELDEDPDLFGDLF